MRTVLLQLWKLLDPRQKRRMVLLQVLSVFMAFSSVLGIVSVMPFFAVLAEPEIVHSNRWLAMGYEWSGASDERQFVVMLGLLLVALVIGSSLMNLLGTLAMTRFSFWVGNGFQVALFNEYLNRDYLFHARTNSATLINNTTYEVGRIMSGILQNGIGLVTNSITILAIVGSILVVNPLVAVVSAVVVGGTYALVYAMVRSRLLRNGRIQSEVGGRRWKVLNEGFGGIKEVIVLGTRRVFSREFEELSWSISRVQADTQVVSIAPKFVLESVAVGGLVLVALILSGRGGGDGAWLAQLTFLGLAAYRLLPAIQQVFTAVARMRADQASFDRVHRDILLGVRRSRSNDDRRLSVGDAAWPSRSIELENVQFRYQPDRPWALRGVDLSIRAGTSVAFVGPSGSGKTTVADVILALFTPDTGRVLIDGEPLGGSNRERWQSVLGYVPQTIFLTDNSIAENIALGIARDKIDMEQVRRVGRMAQIDEFVSALPRGYDEIVGERGVRLSGGQRQRIGIARALYRNASVLVMDEATSALDGLTEQEVMSAIEGLQGQRTIILIAHRLTTVRHCDRIFEFEEGRVVRSGTYDELLEQSERFRRMAGEPAAPVKA